MQLKKYLPTRDQLKQTRSLQFLGEVLLEPNLWHFNRYSLSMAFLIGSICAFLPIPFQTIPCILICFWIHCNVPVAVAVVWVSNPITMGPMMYFAYRVGSAMMGVELEPIPPTPTLAWFTAQLGSLWQPLILGCLTCGTVIGLTGFVIIRLYYRWRIARYIRRRRQRRPGEVTRI